MPGSETLTDHSPTTGLPTAAHRAGQSKGLHIGLAKARVCIAIFHRIAIAYRVRWEESSRMIFSDNESEMGGELKNVALDGSRSVTVLLSTLLDGRRRFVELP